jgi:hypothetical protein
MAEPKIYSKNYVSSDCTFTLSHSGTSAKLYDRDVATLYQTSGANSDVTDATIVIDFKEGSTSVTRTIDTCILLGHNLKAWELEYWNGSAYVSIQSLSALSNNYSVISFSQVSTTKIRLTLKSTQTVNQEKQIGELIVALQTLAFSQELETYDQDVRQKAVEIPLADGSIHRTFVMWTSYRSTKYQARARFSYLTSAEIVTLYALRDSGASFLWHPESTSRPDQIFYVQWVTGRLRYATAYKGAGHQIEMELKEV